jgi:hypothetical protein
MAEPALLFHDGLYGDDWRVEWTDVTAASSWRCSLARIPTKERSATLTGSTANLRK